MTDIQLINAIPDCYLTFCHKGKIGRYGFGVTDMVSHHYNCNIPFSGQFFDQCQHLFPQNGIKGRKGLV